MPTATPFKTFALCNLPSVDVTIGNEVSFSGTNQTGTIVDYVTLGGHKGSTNGSTATQASIDASYDAAHKLYYNLHGIDADATGTGSASASVTNTLNFTYVSSIDEEGDRTTATTSISASASASNSGFSDSFPSYSITSNEPVNRICGTPTINAGFYQDNDSVFDFNSDSNTFDPPYGGDLSVSASANTVVSFEGLTNGPDFELGFATRPPAIFKCYDSGNFVGYGVAPLFESSYLAGAGAGASGGHPTQSTSSGGICITCATIYTDEPSGINCDKLEDKTFTTNGVSLFLVAGTVNDDGSITLSVSGGSRSVSSSNSKNYPSTTITSNLPDSEYITNKTLTSVASLSASHTFDFDFDLDFYTY